MTTNYQRLFGDPERAARTMEEVLGAIDGKLTESPAGSLCNLFDSCCGCPLDGMCSSWDRTLEWLESEAE